MNPQELCKSGSEHSHQVALFAWANMAAKYGFAAADDMTSYANQSYVMQRYGTANAVPTLDDMFAIPNGGERHKAVAGKLKAEGVKKGVSDIFLPVPREDYCGLFIELKKPADTKGASDAQAGFINRMLERGYAANVAVGWLQASQLIKWYYDVE